MSMAAPRHSLYRLGARLSPSLLGLALAAGCLRSDGPSESVARYDSAGVRVVVNTIRPNDLPGRRLSRPRLTIGKAFGPAAYEFHRVTAAHVLPGGDVVVADAGTHLVKLFSETGAFLFSVGGPGSGPGEIQTISSFVTDPNGGFAVYDRSLARLTRWSSDGKLKEITSIPPLPSGLFNSLYTLSNGGLVGVRIETAGASREPERAGLRRDNAFAVYIDQQRRVRDTVAVFPGDERYYHGNDEYDYVRFTIPLFAARAVFAYSNDCVYAVVSRLVSVGEFCISTRRPRSVEEVTLKRRFDWTAATLELRRHDVVAHARAAFMRRTGLNLGPTEFEAKYPFDLPQQRPPGGGMVVDKAGNIWVADYFETDMPATSWMVFDAGGVLRHRYDLPQVYRILSIGRDYLVALERDELNVERVAIYDLPG